MVRKELLMGGIVRGSANLKRADQRKAPQQAKPKIIKWYGRGRRGGEGSPTGEAEKG
jgi:hypothetical protein